MRYFLIITILVPFILCACNSGSGSAHNNVLVLNAKSNCGATGDGVSDDSMAIQSCLNQLEIGNGGELYFPAGTYRVTQPLLLNATGNTVLIGDGVSSTIDGSGISKDKYDSSKGAMGVLTIQGEKKLVGQLLVDANQTAQHISIAFESQQELSRGSAIEIVSNRVINTNGSMLPAQKLSVRSEASPAHPKGTFGVLEKVVLTTYSQEGSKTNFFTPDTVGQSIVFPLTPTENSIFQNPTIYITKVNADGTANGVVGNDQVLNLANSVVEPGNWGILRLWDKSRGYYVKGELNNVTTVTGNSLTLQTPLADSYMAKNTNIYEISPYAATIKQLNIKGKGDITSELLSLRYLATVHIDTSNFITANNNGLSVKECGNTQVLLNDSTVKDITQGVDNYGVVFNSVNHVTVTKGSYQSGQHAMTTGGTFPNRNIMINGSTFLDNGNAYALDFHGNSESITLNEIDSQGGFGYDGKNLAIINSIFENKRNGSPDSAAFISPEVNSDYIMIKDSYFISTRGTALGLSNSYIDIPQDSQLQIKYPYGYISQIILDNTTLMNSGTSGSNLHGMYIQPLKLNGMPMNFVKVSIQNNSKVSSVNGFGLMGYNNGLRLKLESLEVVNSTISSNAELAIYWMPQLDTTDMTNNLNIHNSMIYSGAYQTKDAGILLYYNNSITMDDNRFNGQNLSKIVDIIGFNSATISNNVFSNWGGITTNEQLNKMLGKYITPNENGALLMILNNTVVPTANSN